MYAQTRLPYRSLFRFVSRSHNHPRPDHPLVSLPTCRQQHDVRPGASRVPPCYVHVTAVCSIRYAFNTSQFEQSISSPLCMLNGWSTYIVLFYFESVHLGGDGDLGFWRVK